jgi:uncharacterized protein YdaU (DUF1376 family)
MGKHLFWYARDLDAYGRDTRHLTMLEHGAYTLLLDQYYRNKGYLPTDPAKLFLICGAATAAERTAVNEIAEQFFPIGPDDIDAKRYNNRADDEIKKSFEISNKRSAAVNKRWADVRALEYANVHTNVIPPTPTPTQDQKKKPKPLGRTDVRPNGFEDFWLAYPRKVKRVDALKTWTKLNPDPALQLAISAGIIRAKAGDGWRKDSGRFIPYPATWLNARQWEDEVPPAAVDGQVAGRFDGELACFGQQVWKDGRWQSSGRVPI